MRFAGNSIWIIGASSGIGYALAKELASQGAVLALSSRDHTKLEVLRNEIGHEHHVFSFDVTDRTAFNDALSQIVVSFKKIDRIIYMAAAYQPMLLSEMDAEMTASIIDTNLNGPFNFIQAITPLIKNNTVRQIALCGSAAGYCGLPNGQPYSATKAAIINLTQSLRAELPKEIDVKLISPGFVRTRLTNKNTFHMPMMIEPEQAAKAIAAGLLTDKFEISFPKPFIWLMKIVSLMPYGLYFNITKKLNP